MLNISGRAWVLFAFDVGRAIDLARCRTLGSPVEVAGARRPEWPHLFGLDERPLVWNLEQASVDLGAGPLDLQVRIILYDFGNVSVAVSGPVDLGDPASPLWMLPGRTDALDAMATARLNQMVERLGPAIVDPQPVVGPTRYSVLHVESVPGGDARAWLAANRREVAGLLRGESELSDEAVSDALYRSVTYGKKDLVVLDSLSALVIDEAWEDTLAVLDFANCERLTMESLDEELDRAIGTAGALLRTTGSRLGLIFRPWGRDVTRLTRLTLDVTSEYEAVENAVKLTGDDYLARIYRMAIKCFHLRPFQEGIARKLQSLWNIQQVFLEQAAAHRSELLEWVIILLIAFEIVHALT